MIPYNKPLRKILIAALLTVQFSCSEFLDIDLSESQITNEKVFSDDITAQSAVAGVYYDLLDENSFASGSDKSVIALTGLTSDELKSYSPDVELLSLNENVLSSRNRLILQLWQSLYKTIYESNSIIEGVDHSKSMSTEGKKRIDAEARFVRSFCYFYLVNLFGDVPLITSTDYRVNSVITRSSTAEVYRQVVGDLNVAQDNLSNVYVSADRARPNKATASALLARVYLFLGDWKNAEAVASSIISNTDYELSDIDQVFKFDSRETIWQLKPINPDINTQEGYFFILDSSPENNYPGSNALNVQLVEDFEIGDRRRDSWIGTFAEDTNVWYYANKYKVKYGGDPIEEYSIVFRLAEQYLVRAEARAHMDNLENAIMDVDAVRERAGLPLLRDTSPNINRDEFLLSLEHERRIELFLECGSRWLDLKRTNRATEVLASKGGWDINDVLYPIPQAERDKNPKLGEQNSGY